MHNAIDPQVATVVKALMYAENGGHPSTPKKGKTGELKSTFQFTPDTWDVYSEQVSGKKLPLTPENEAAVTYAKVKAWYDADISHGFSPDEAVKRVASRWNAGEHRPDAYSQNWKGMNKKYGVAFDTPAYANKVMGYVKQFEKKEAPTEEAKTVAGKPTEQSEGMLKAPPTTPQPNVGLITPPMKQVRQV